VSASARDRRAPGDPAGSAMSECTQLGVPFGRSVRSSWRLIRSHRAAEVGRSRREGRSVRITVGRRTVRGALAPNLEF